MYQDTTTLKKIEEMSARIKVVQGGARAGKTIAILIILCDLSFEEKGKVISIVTDSYPNLEKGAMRDWTKLLKATGRERYFKANLSKHTWTNLVTDTTIEFFSCDADDALGAGRDHLFINEASRVSIDTYNQLAMRTTGQIWLDFNPINEFWVHTDILKRPKGVEFLKVTYKDNEAIPDAVLEELLSHKGDGNNNFWRVYGLGEIGSLEGNIYQGWQAVDEAEIVGNGKLVRYGLDFGFTNDETAMAAVYEMPDGSFGLIEKIYQTGILTSQYPAMLKSKEIDPSVLIVADSVRPETIAEIKHGGFRCIGCEKGAGSILRGIDRVSEKKILYCGKNLEREFLTYAWRKKKSGEVLDEPQDGNDHLMDAIRYAIDDLARPRFDF